MPGNCSFNEKWFEKAEYQNWLRKHPSDKHLAMCVVCKKSIHLACMGEGALKSHLKGKAHQRYEKCSSGVGRSMDTFLSGSANMGAIQKSSEESAGSRLSSSEQGRDAGVKEEQGHASLRPAQGPRAQSPGDVRVGPATITTTATTTTTNSINNMSSRGLAGRRKRRRSSEDSDGDEAFFESCALRIKKLPGRTRSFLKLQISELFVIAENPDLPPVPLTPLPGRSGHGEAAQTLRHVPHLPSGPLPLVVKMEPHHDSSDIPEPDHDHHPVPSEDQEDDDGDEDDEETAVVYGSDDHDDDSEPSEDQEKEDEKNPCSSVP